MEKFIPEKKTDFKALEILKTTDWAEVLPHIDKLLIWVQDMNWPIAYDLAMELSRHTNSFYKKLIDVLRTNDSIWKYHCIRVIIYNTPDGYIEKELLAEVRRLAENPSEDEKDFDVDEVAQRVLDKFR